MRGRHAWVALEDHWLAPGEDAGLYRRLYAAAAPAWVEADYLEHYVVVPAERDVLDVWYSLSFAQQQVHGTLELAPLEPSTPEGFTVRRGGPDDLEAAMALAYVIFDHQAEGPTWAGAPAPSEEEARGSYGEYLADPNVTYFVAERDAEPLGHLALERESDEVVYLAVAATVPAARGLGVGTALTDAALSWAYDQGFRTCVTDWRAANLLSSRFWTQRGFEPTAYRLFRSVQVTRR
ncbi:MAG TPA: GNAT family N-acetyltransferase [Gaiellaceae bacterium]|nr:GNAT family N-acetyltransferase [Gaiellaceae bacterium]